MNETTRRIAWAAVVAASSGLVAAAYVLTQPPLVVMIVVSAAWLVAVYVVLRKVASRAPWWRVGLDPWRVRLRGRIDDWWRCHVLRLHHVKMGSHGRCCRCGTVVDRG